MKKNETKKKLKNLEGLKYLQKTLAFHNYIVTITLPEKKDFSYKI